MTKGKHWKLSEKTKKYLSEISKKLWQNPEFRKRTTEAMKGKSRSEEARRKMSEVQKGKLNSLGFKGKHHREETKKRLSETHKGTKNWNWKGGISFEPYSPAFTKELKEAIRQRDGYTCAICGEYPAFDCHHIDYDKKNCEPENLITLCRNCHMKTNSNREHWKRFLTQEKEKETKDKKTGYLI